MDGGPTTGGLNSPTTNAGSENRPSFETAIRLSDSEDELTTSILFDVQNIRDVLHDYTTSRDEEMIPLEERGAVSTPPPPTINGYEILNKSSSTCCRICQLSAQEGEEELRGTGCRCTGSLCLCHQTCLQRWVDEQNSVRCEICHQRYTDVQVPVPRPPPAVHFIQRREPTSHLTAAHQIQMCMLDRRGFVWLMFWVLVLVVAVSSYLTHWTAKIYRKMIEDPLVPKSELDKANVMFASSLFVLTIAIITLAFLICLSCVACCSALCERDRSLEMEEQRRILGLRLVNGEITIEEFWSAYIAMDEEATINMTQTMRDF